MTAIIEEVHDYDHPALVNAANEAKRATSNLSAQEKEQRDIAFKQSVGYTERDGWLWNICWDAAKSYYEQPYRVGMNKPSRPIPPPSGMPHIGPRGEIKRKKDK